MPTPATDKLPIIKDEKQSRKLGSLLVESKEGKIALPLTAVDIKAEVVSRISSVTIKQKFSNPYTDFLEAVYIFPICGGSAVSKFEMRVKDRVIVGKVDERQQARADYAKALQEGKRAALMEQERDDVFTLQVGNLPPGEEVEITISYSERLPYFESGKTELRLPLVVGRRYVPGTPLEGAAVGEGVIEDTDLVPDASRITPPRLAPGLKADLTLSINVEIATDGEPISDLSCSQHATSTAIENGRICVSLSRTDEMMDRDFVLNWRLAGQSISSTLYVLKSKGEGAGNYAMLSIVPPRIDGFTGPARDVVFVLDRSGSMQGIKMSSAVRACSILLETLSPRDRFAVVAFDNVTEWMGGRSAATFYEADEEGLERGHKFLRTIDARGGTELWHALSGSIQALDTRTNKDARVPIIVVLTDGEVGDESRILKSIQKELKDTRMFTIGIDTTPNTGLLKRLADLGGGTVSFVQPGTQLETALINIGREIGVPLVTDIQIESANKKISLTDLAPSPVPDLFAGRSVNVFFRLPDAKEGTEFSVTGIKQDKSKFSERVKLVHSKTEAIAQLWAKSLVTSLEDQYRSGAGSLDKIKERIISIAKSHSLLTKFTAFVVVDEAEVVNKDGTRRKVVQPVNEPALWELGQDDAPLNLAQSVRRKMAYGAGAPAPMPAQSQYAQFQSCQAPEPEAFGAADAWGAPPAAGSWGAAPSASPMPASPPPAAPGSGGTGSREKNTLMGQLVRQSQPKGGAPTPPGQPPAQPPAGGGMGGLLSPFKNMFGGGHRDQGSSANHESLAHAMAEFYRALSALWSTVKSGQTVDGKALAAARDALLAELSTSDVASQLPELQRFLRVEMQSLLAALNSPATTADDLKKLCEQSETAFEKVASEVNVKLRLDMKTGNPGQFWESSI